MASLLRYKPVYERGLYRCSIDGRFLLKSFHLSGILLLKTMPDTSTRVVFQNETGFPFFDFEWDRSDSFRVVSVNEKMDRPALIALLRKDFELLLMKGLRPASEQSLFLKNSAGEGAPDFKQGRRFDLKRGFVDYFFHKIQPPREADSAVVVDAILNFGKRLVVGIEVQSAYNDTTLHDRQPAVQKGWVYTDRRGVHRDGLPAAFTVTHQRAGFTIQLSRLPTPPNPSEHDQQPD